MVQIQRLTTCCLVTTMQSMTIFGWLIQESWVGLTCSLHDCNIAYSHLYIWEPAHYIHTVHEILVCNFLLFVFLYVFSVFPNTLFEMMAKFQSEPNIGLVHQIPYWVAKPDFGSCLNQVTEQYVICQVCGFIRKSELLNVTKSIYRRAVIRLRIQYVYV